MSTEITILFGVGLYLLVMLVIGLMTVRRADTVERFVVAGRTMPLWICAATVMATWFGGGTMMGSAGAAYEGGLLAVIADPFGGALALFLVGFFFVRIFRRLKLLTVIDFFQTRYGKVAAMIATIGLISSNLGWTGGLLVAFGFVFETLTDVPLEIGIACGALIVIIYTTAGGMWAVAITDFVQMLIISIGLIVLLLVVLLDVGGWGAISPQLPETTFRMIPLEHNTSAWLTYLRMWLIIGLADISAQSLLQRAFSARTEQVAQNAFYLAAFGYLAIGLVAVALGIIASVTLPGLDDPEAVIPTLALQHLHPIAIAFFVGALLAAIMSSADSALLAAASIFGNNVMPYFKPAASDQDTLRYTRIIIPVLGVIALFVALKARVIYQLILDANSVILVCVVVPFIAGIWWRKANRSGALAAMAAGFVVWLGSIVLFPGLPGDLLGLLAALVALLIVTPLTQAQDPPRGLVDGDGNAIEYDNRLGILPLFRRLT